ncbi:MAG: hypothetical protein WC455_09980 [Dehalococcoidia bacterium]|jgi:hypothetical protein
METVTREEMAKSINMMRTALNRIIEMNVQYAVDLHGDASKAEYMACVKVCRGTLAAADHILFSLDAPAAETTREQKAVAICRKLAANRDMFCDRTSDQFFGRIFDEAVALFPKEKP